MKTGRWEEKKSLYFLYFDMYNNSYHSNRRTLEERVLQEIQGKGSGEERKMANAIIRAAIVGSTGYGGVELIRLLQAHPSVTITSVISSSSAGAGIAEGFPHLQDIMVHTLDGIDVEAMSKHADVVFLATPSGVSAELAPKLVDAGLMVIDLSGDFRLKSGELYEKNGISISLRRTDI